MSHLLPDLPWCKFNENIPLTLQKARPCFILEYINDRFDDQCPFLPRFGSVVSLQIQADGDAESSVADIVKCDAVSAADDVIRLKK